MIPYLHMAVLQQFVQVQYAPGEFYKLQPLKDDPRILHRTFKKKIHNIRETGEL